MAERGEQVPDDRELSAAELAGELAAELRELAALAATPAKNLNISAFAEQLHNMAQDQAALAAHLAENEEGAPHECAEAHDALPPGQAAPLTFEALNCAVALLTHDAHTRIWPDQEAAELPGLVAEAVVTVQAAAKALHGFFLALRPAKALHDARDERPPSAVATGAAAEAASTFVRAFADRADLAAPFGALADMLLDVQLGGHKPRFSQEARAKDNRHTAWWRAAAMGEAAIALDARWRAAKLEAAVQGTRPPKMGRMALVVAEAVAPAFPQAELSKRVLAGKVVGWRVQAMNGHRGSPKGFKAGHPALRLWAKYLVAVVENPDLGGRWGATEWLGFAERTEARIRAESGQKGGVPDEDLGGMASLAARRAS